MATIKWSGRSWDMGTDAQKHPGFAWNQNITVDGNGYLHLDLVKANGVWQAPMLISEDSLGYGTYQVLLSDIHVLDKDTVLGLFAYAYQNQHEIDILEQALWGSVANYAFQFTVQPSSETGLTAQDKFDLTEPQNDILVTLVWTPTGEGFTIQDATGKILRVWTSTIPVNALSPVPVKMYLNLYPRCDFTKNVSYPPATEQHYVIKSFTYTPLGLAPPIAVTPVEVVTPVVIPPAVSAPAAVAAPAAPVMTITIDGRTFKIALEEVV
jgi:hypothetical protein